MDVRILVSREADKASFAGFASGHQRFHGAAWSEEPVRIVEADGFVKLQKIEMISL